MLKNVFPSFFSFFFLTFALTIKQVLIKNSINMRKSINFKENRNVVRNNNIERYRIEMERYPAINDDELRTLIIAAQKGNERARTKVINANLRIVWSIAASYGTMDVFEDMLQNGNYGLCIAVDTFDVSRGTMFSTWALEEIRKYINIGLTNESRTIRKSAHLINEHYEVASLDAPISNDEGEDKTLLDTFASDFHTDEGTKVNDMRTEINYLLEGLDNREKEIICGLFGFGCREYTQYELALRFNLTEERVRQIKFEALKKMQQMK